MRHRAINSIQRMSSRLLMLLSLGLFTFASTAADHGDAPLVANDQGADIADVYAFLDPNDNDFVVMILTARGFIVPGESENLGFFQSRLNWRFAIDNSGDAAPDFNIEVEFDDRQGFDIPQNANVRVRQGSDTVAEFTAPTTLPSATSPIAPEFVVTTDSSTNISFFAGMVDDPFFFDVPAELLFRASLQAGQGDPSVFERGRDTFAGYNVMAAALRVPTSLIDGGGSALGISGYTELAQRTKRSRNLGLRDKGRFVNLDRMGIPGINTVLLPYPNKDNYNRGSTVQDSNGVYASDIVASLQALGTSEENINFLAGLAVSNGDILRLNLSTENSGPGGGTNTGGGFPNGRRLQDDVIDVVVNIIANQLFSNDPGLGGVVDNVNGNDKTFGDTFPFLAPPHQPAATGTVDDGTRN